jgi:putative tricarboxylic transport membrane protein
MTISRRHFLAGTVAAGLVPHFASRAEAQAAIDMLQLFVPAAPGGGWDGTARTMEAVLRNTSMISAAQVTNVGGAGGTVGFPQFINQWKGRPNALMISGMVMVGAIIANKSPFKLTQATPIARLTGEFQALAVPTNSPFKTVKDFADAFKADPTKVPIAGGSAGGSDHIMAGMIAKALGVPAARLSYVAFAGGGPAQAAIIGGQVAAGISGYGEFAEQAKAGKMRILAISADKRQAGIDVPTLKEGGLDVELFNWRGVFAPPGVTADQKKAMVDLMTRMNGSDAWKAELTKRDWTGIFLAGDDFGKYITSEEERIGAILKDLGIG